MFDKELESPTLKYSTYSPPISLNTSISEQMTGTENDKASSIGIPNPSSSEGNTYILAFLYNILASSLEMYPGKITLLSSLFLTINVLISLKTSELPLIICAPARTSFKLVSSTNLNALTRVIKSFLFSNEPICNK